MTNASSITDSQIFDALRESIKPAKLTQLLVDITNISLSIPETREAIIKALRLEQSAFEDKREYNLTPATLKQIYPSANPAAISYILKYAPVYGVITKKQMAAFLATVLIESMGFKATRESFNYKPERLLKVFPSRVKTLSNAVTLCAKGPVAIANFLYNGRYGNSATGNDGFKYRGGGWIQTTFKDNYRATESRTGIPLSTQPELIEQMDVAAIAAFDYWKNRGCNEAASAINVYKDGYTLNTLNSKGVETKDVRMNTGISLVRKLVNGGYNSLEEVADVFQKAMKYL
jgi:putative chitinase